MAYFELWCIIIFERNSEEFSQFVHIVNKYNFFLITIMPQM